MSTYSAVPDALKVMARSKTPDPRHPRTGTASRHDIPAIIERAHASINIAQINTALKDGGQA